MPLDPSFRSRLREALQQSRSHVQVEPRVEAEEERRHRVDQEQATWIADALGGWWNRDSGGACLVVDRVYPADRVHGDAEIGNYAETLSRYRASLRAFDSIASAPPIQPVFSEMEDGSDDGDCGPASAVLALRATEAGRSPASESAEDERLLFFDLETTGLTGGAGTCAFLIGYGWFECGSFRTRQYFLGGFGHEPAMLRMAGDVLSGATLTSFNGKTFDVPLIVGRYLFHRLPCPFDAIRHVDLLHPARRLWRHRPADSSPAQEDGRRAAFARYFRMTRSTGVRLARDGSRRLPGPLSESAASCALGALEEAVLGYRRTGDVPGGEIPGRYFQYVRTGDVRPLSPVLEHNRLDLVSLAALASVVARMLQEGPHAARNAHECLALGRLYEHSGASDRATACYEKAVEGDPAAAWRRDELVEREALRRLALRHRRERRYPEAAAAWQRLLDLPGTAGPVDFEALHALAVHYEHRARDLEAARALVIRAMDCARNPKLSESLRYRLMRIDRKLAVGLARRGVERQGW